MEGHNVEHNEPASILIVDDNPANLRMLVEYFRTQALNVMVATNGEQALTQLQHFQPDLILLDVLMPGIDGFEACRRLKRDETTRDIPVIFMTALSDTVDKLTGFQVGGVDYVTKPFQYEELVARVHTHLTLRALQRQLQEENERFRRLVEATFEGIVIHNQGQIVEVNQVILNSSGYQYADLIGQPVLKFVVPAYHEVVARRMEIADESPCEVEVFVRDGTTLIVEVQAKKVTYQGSDVRVAAVRDISDRKRVEGERQAITARVEQAKRDWESTADSLASVVCLLDKQRRIIRANRTVEQWNLGRVGNVKGREIHALFHPGCSDTTCALMTFVNWAWNQVALGQAAESEIEDSLLGRFLHIQIRPVSSRPNQAGLESESFAVCSVSDITDRKQTEKSLRQRNHELAVLNRMNERFQVCHSEPETYQVVSTVCQELFPLDSGRVYMLDEAQESCKLVKSWGNVVTGDSTFPVDQCRALQSSKPYFVEDPADFKHPCAYLHTSKDAQCFCVPIQGPNQVLGVLRLCPGHDSIRHSGRERHAWVTSRQMIIPRVTEHYGLFLVNLRLRERLRLEAIHDPLTGLYNRRHMEVALDREVHRASRHATSIGIIMFDIDHFKDINDTYGHEVGDIILRELGQLMQRHIRAADIACRYGGDEFLLILSEAPLDTVKQRAEELRVMISNFLTVNYQEDVLNPTISVGVAALPSHGYRIQEVINAADKGLYEAKTRGRNQVFTIPPQHAES